MAALQKVRSWGPLLIGALGLALLFFIIEPFAQSLGIFKAESSMRLGKIYGESVNQPEFSQMVDEYADVVKFTQGTNSLTDEQMSMLRDQVWQSLVADKLIQHECEKLGITVTEAEMQDIINTGRSPMLAQTPFRTQQGTFDVNALKQFLSQYKEIMGNAEIPAETKEQYTQMYNYWKFIKKSIRQQTLQQKYEMLLSSLIVSNPVAAKASFEGKANESDIVMAALPFTSINDNDITAEDADLKAKYEEKKELFRTIEETRDIKYIDIAIVASEADKADLQKEMEEYAKALAEGADPAKTVREAASLVPYSAMPISAKSLPHDIAEALDSLSVGSQVGPYLHAHDNSINVVRLLDKVTLPDSVEVRQIAAVGDDMESMEKTADSIMTALAAGADFDTIAKKYNQPATKNWIVSQQYEGQVLDENTRKFLNTVTTAAVGTNNKIVMDNQGVVIAQVTDRRNVITKYNVAAIKRAINFSKDTYDKAYNKFSSFLAGNTKLEDIEANAAAEGYTVQTRNGISNTEHKVANVSSTRDAMRWIFNEDTKVGEVSPLYECGDNDHLLAICLNGINPKGYIAWDDEQVKTYLTSEVVKDKKAATIIEKMASAKSIEEIAKMADAVSDTIKHVSFGNTAFVSKTGAQEPIISGAVYNAKKGDFKAGLKGNAGVYAIKVISQNKSEAKYDEKQEKRDLEQSQSRSIGNYFNELLQNANITDNRYRFY